MEKIHGGTSGAHLGVNKTLVKVREERLYWVHCREVVDKWYVFCAAAEGQATCAKGITMQSNVEAPFERIAIHHSPTGNNEYIFVAMDSFRKWYNKPGNYNIGTG